MLSFFSALVIAGPLLSIEAVFFLLCVFGVCIGSLVPDVDAEDAAIFHSNIRGVKGDTGRLLNDFLAPLLPVFGYFTKYVIYRPSVLLFNILSKNYAVSDTHREFSHSIIGITSFTFFTGLYVSLILYLAGLLHLTYLIVFLGGYLIGCILHLIQDSCTRTGIAWNSPFSDWKIKGDIYTGKDFRKIKIFTLVLGGLSSTIVFISLTQPIGLSTLQLSALSLTLLGFLWAVFMLFAKVELAR